MPLYSDFRWTEPSLERNRISQSYEPIQPHLLFRLAQHFGCKTFLDVGSNIGLYALFLSRVVEQVHAFEAAPETFAELEKNIALNGGAIAAHRIAASDKSCTVTFGAVSHMSGANSIVETSIHTNFVRTYEVQAAPLDDLLSIDGPFCAKVDVEGHEPAVLRGMAQILELPGILQIEGYNERTQVDGYEHLLDIGPDSYFSNMQISDKDLLAILERAATDSVETLKDILANPPGVRPLNLALGPLNVQWKGPGMNAWRKIKSSIGQNS